MSLYAAPIHETVKSLTFALQGRRAFQHSESTGKKGDSHVPMEYTCGLLPLPCPALPCPALPHATVAYLDVVHA